MSPESDQHDPSRHHEPAGRDADTPEVPAEHPDDGEGGPGGGDVDPMRHADAANGEPAATEPDSTD